MACGRGRKSMYRNVLWNMQRKESTTICFLMSNSYKLNIEKLSLLSSKDYYFAPFIHEWKCFQCLNLYFKFSLQCHSLRATTNVSGEVACSHISYCSFLCCHFLFLIWCFLSEMTPFSSFKWLGEINKFGFSFYHLN